MCLHDRDPASPEPVYFPSGLSLSTTDPYDAKEFIDSDTEGTFCAYFQCSEHHISSEQVFESLSQTMVEEEQAGFRPNYVACALIYLQLILWNFVGKPKNFMFNSRTLPVIFEPIDATSRKLSALFLPFLALKQSFH
ncbi:hypothetical protein C8R45DRAFT_1102067 [Mycena sanguinolenta]|nr:hypothetical protein C8R45DRAFT_1102067 [Mycena sanguinolenta]